MADDIKIGDLVRVVRVASLSFDELGMVTDMLEGTDGFCDYEVVFPNDRGWFQDVELRVINESR